MKEILILNVVFLVCSAYYDARMLNNGKRFTEHAGRAIIRVLFITISSLFTGSPLEVFTGLVLMWGALFDLLVNLLWRDVEWHHLGQTAKWDIAMRKIFSSGKFYYIEKGVIFVGYLIYMFV